MAKNLRSLTRVINTNGIIRTQSGQVLDLVPYNSPVPLVGNPLIDEGLIASWCPDRCIAYDFYKSTRPLPLNDQQREAVRSLGIGDLFEIGCVQYYSKKD